MYYLYSETKALMSCALTDAQLICVFVFAFAKSQISHNEAHLYFRRLKVRKCLCSSHPFKVPARPEEASDGGNNNNNNNNSNEYNSLFPSIKRVTGPNTMYRT